VADSRIPCKNDRKSNLQEDSSGADRKQCAQGELDSQQASGSRVNQKNRKENYVYEQNATTAA